MAITIQNAPSLGLLGQVAYNAGRGQEETRRREVNARLQLQRIQAAQRSRQQRLNEQNSAFRNMLALRGQNFGMGQQQFRNMLNLGLIGPQEEGDRVVLRLPPGAPLPKMRLPRIPKKGRGKKGKDDPVPVAAPPVPEAGAMGGVGRVPAPRFGWGEVNGGLAPIGPMPTPQQLNDVKAHQWGLIDGVEDEANAMRKQFNEMNLSEKGRKEADRLEAMYRQLQGMKSKYLPRQYSDLLSQWMNQVDNANLDSMVQPPPNPAEEVKSNTYQDENGIVYRSSFRNGVKSWEPDMKATEFLQKQKQMAQRPSDAFEGWKVDQGFDGYNKAYKSMYDELLAKKQLNPQFSQSTDGDGNITTTPAPVVPPTDEEVEEALRKRYQRFSGQNQSQQSTMSQGQVSPLNTGENLTIEDEDNLRRSFGSPSEDNIVTGTVFRFPKEFKDDNGNSVDLDLKVKGFGEGGNLKVVMLDPDGHENGEFTVTREQMQGAEVISVPNKNNNQEFNSETLYENPDFIPVDRKNKIFSVSLTDDNGIMKPYFKRYGWARNLADKRIYNWDMRADQEGNLYPVVNSQAEMEKIGLQEGDRFIPPKKFWKDGKPVIFVYRKK